MKIEQFVKERDEALLSLDEQKIRAMIKQWNGIEMPQGQLFWAVVHKAITGAVSLPIEFRKQSKAWLRQHGLKSCDGGEL